MAVCMCVCMQGSLRAALDKGQMVDPATGRPQMSTVLMLAHDVACAMHHLHTEGVIHGDLKANNVLLKQGVATNTAAGNLPTGAMLASRAAYSAGCSVQRTAAAGFVGAQPPTVWTGAGSLVAKVADFGLSLTLGPTDTHVSHMHGVGAKHYSSRLYRWNCGVYFLSTALFILIDRQQQQQHTCYSLCGSSPSPCRCLQIVWYILPYMCRYSM